MADVFREVDEELTRDRYRAIFDRYWKFGAAILAVVLSVVAAREIIAWRASERGDTASQSYFEGLAALSEGRTGEARRTFAELARSGPTGYRLLARVHEGAAALEEGERLQASAAFEQAARLADNALMRDLSQLKAAYARADDLSAADLRALVEPLAEPGRPFSLAARELLAAAELANGDLALARDEYRALVLDPQLPPQMRGRVEQALAVISARTALARSAEEAEASSDDAAAQADGEGPASADETPGGDAGPQEDESE